MPKATVAPEQAEFGQTIRTHRKAQKLSQRELGLKCGKEGPAAQTFISQIERGIYKISGPLIATLAQGLGMTPDQLGGSPNGHSAVEFSDAAREADRKIRQDGQREAARREAIWEGAKVLQQRMHYPGDTIKVEDYLGDVEAVLDALKPYQESLW